MPTVSPSPNPAKPEPESLPRKQTQTERAFRAGKPWPSVQGLCGLGPKCFFTITVLVLALTIALIAVMMLPNDTLAQRPPPSWDEPALSLRATPLSAPSPLQVNPPAATLEPGNSSASTTPPDGSVDLDVVRFRPDITLQRGEFLPAASVEKPAGAVSLDRTASGEDRRPQAAYQALDVAGLMAPMDWSLMLYEDFESIFPGSWNLYDFSDDGYQRTWGDTNFASYTGTWSAWPAAGGADALDPWVTWWYTDNLNSWMEYGPLDFSTMSDVFVSFGLYYDTEPDYDWVYFCTSTDGVSFDCDYWSGDSDGWTDQAYWLTSYAGYSQVWLAWIFQSDGSISSGYFGPYVDEIQVWGYEGSGDPTPTPTPDPAGDLILNGSFETGDLSSWETFSSAAMSGPDGIAQPPVLGRDEDPARDLSNPEAVEDHLNIASVGVISSTYVDGQYSAYLWRDGTGNDYLYQPFDVPTDVTDIVLNFWFAVTTDESEMGRDFFCASLRPDNLEGITVDLGCVDSIDATGHWQEVLYTLSDVEVTDVAGQSVALTFELYNTGEAGTGSAGWVDYVRVHANGSSAAGYIDPHEPNDGSDTATDLTCGETITGVIGDALGGYDVDWFKLNVPAGQLEVDINADTKVPPSALDSVISLWDSGINEVAWNDDDMVSYDSYLVYTNTVDDALYYISVESYSGSGSPDSFYDLKVQCAVTETGAPTGGSEQPPDEDTWTVMLYLNAEDPGFETILNQYRANIEEFIGSKSSFLQVAILYDGPGDNDTTRYLVQPNGNYQDGVNRWSQGELNMGHPDTLANFVSWGMDQYPAENYYLAVDDHGDGVYGISWDRTSNNDQLTPPELYAALKSATRNGARKIDIFDYEACLMGLTENAYDLREWVDYVVFFEQISWGINTYPVYFGDLGATDPPTVVGQRIVDRYHTQANTEELPHTISLIDTSQMADVSDAVTDLGDAIRATNTQTQKDAVNAARDRSQAFAADNDATNPLRAEYIDLWDLADEASGLAPSPAAALKAAVEAAVVHERHASGGVSGYIWNHQGAYGLSIYYPVNTSSSAFNSYVAPSLYQMSRDGTWDEFLTWAVPGGDRRGMNTHRSTVRRTSGDTFIFKYVYLPIVQRQ